MQPSQAARGVPLRSHCSARSQRGPGSHRVPALKANLANHTVPTPSQGVSRQRDYWPAYAFGIDKECVPCSASLLLGGDMLGGARNGAANPVAVHSRRISN
jgi:hypothetical protein